MWLFPIAHPSPSPTTTGSEVVKVMQISHMASFGVSMELGNRNHLDDEKAFSSHWTIKFPIPELLLFSISLTNFILDYPIKNSIWNILISSNLFSFCFSIPLCFLFNLTHIKEKRPEFAIILTGIISEYWLHIHDYGPAFFFYLIFFAIRGLAISAVFSLIRKYLLESRHGSKST